MSAETIDVPIGAEVEVRLASSPSTGYVWDVADVPPGIDYQGKDVDAARGGSAPGDATTQVFRCRTSRAGVYVVTFTLKRKWEPAPVDTHTVTVRVN